MFVIFVGGKKPVTLPDYQLSLLMIDQRIEFTNHDKDYTNVELHEKAAARCSLLPKAKQ